MGRPDLSRCNMISKTANLRPPGSSRPSKQKEKVGLLHEVESHRGDVSLPCSCTAVHAAVKHPEESYRLISESSMPSIITPSTPAHPSYTTVPGESHEHDWVGDSQVVMSPRPTRPQTAARIFHSGHCFPSAFLCSRLSLRADVARRVYRPGEPASARIGSC